MAQTLFTNLPVAIGLNGTEVVPIDQSNGDGTFTTKQTTTGEIAAIPRAGTTGQRPSSPTTGYNYFDTTLGKPIWWNGSIWVLATGVAA